MLDTISWGEFSKGIGTVLFFYYGFVLVRYFRSDFSDFIKRRNRLGLTVGFDKGENGTGNSTIRWLSDMLLEIDQEIIPRAQTKQELIGQLGTTLHRTQLPDDPSIRGIVIRHILLSSKDRHLGITKEDLLNLLEDALT